MTRPYTSRSFTAHYYTPQDEAVLLVHRTQRRQAISLASGKPRSIYGQISKPFSDDVVVGMYRLHREERLA